jgi:hypothetical protein
MNLPESIDYQRKIIHPEIKMLFCLEMVEERL